jgi:hypothetical protein
MTSVNKLLLKLNTSFLTNLVAHMSSLKTGHFFKFYIRFKFINFLCTLVLNSY